MRSSCHPTRDASPIAGAILAGGRALRMGGIAKGLERVGGQRIVDRVAAAFDDAGIAPRFIVANDPAADGWIAGLPRVADVHAGLGALGGLHAALAHAGTDVLVVAWDMPFVTAALLRALADEGASSGSPVLPRHASARHGVEPLCAFYPRATLQAVERALARGERSIVRAIGPDARSLPDDVVRRIGDPDVLFLGVNTPAELAHARQLAGDA